MSSKTHALTQDRTALALNACSGQGVCEVIGEPAGAAVPLAMRSMATVTAIATIAMQRVESHGWMVGAPCAWGEAQRSR